MIDKLHDGIWADQAKKALREMTKSYSESAKIPMIELGLKEIQRVTTAGVQRPPAETGDGADPASFNFFPTTLHLSHEEIERGKKLRLQSTINQDTFGPVTTEPKGVVEVRTDPDDNYYEIRNPAPFKEIKVKSLYQDRVSNLALEELTLSCAKSSHQI
jgi:hypothetical protein